MKNTYWFFLPLFVIASDVMAASVPTGGVLQPPEGNAAPSSRLPPLDVKKPSPLVVVPEADTDSLKIVVKSLLIAGAQVFPSSELISTCGFSAGRAYTLAQVRGMAALIERYYQNHGYPVAQAYLPAQDINDGVITINVAEGKYGQVLVRNQSHVSAGVLSGALKDIKTGDLVAADALESSLLRLSDLPGVQIKSALVPGATFGSSDLMVDVLPGRRVTGSIDADNAGNYYTGAARVGATIFLNEPTGEGDVASLRLLTSGVGLNYFRAAYQLQVGQARVGAAFSNLEYALGHEFKSLKANGTVRNMGVFASYTLLRSPNQNLYLGGSYESKDFEDRLDSVAYITEKTAHVFTANLNGDRRDNLASGGLSTVALSLSAGEMAIQSAAAFAFDASTAQSNGRYSKLGYSASRLQNLSPSFALYAGINGQLASKNLDASEKLKLGGMFAVRAYPEGEGYGDEGHVINLEARWLLPQWLARATGQLELVGFFDTGSVRLNKTPWSTGSNQRSLSGAGIGLNWYAADKFQLRFIYAHKLGTEAAQSAPDANDRLWLQAIKYF